MTPSNPETESTPIARRTLLSRASQVLMGTGVVAAYGTFASFMARFLYPARSEPMGWMFVAETARLGRGESLRFQTPAGATVNIARQGSGREAADFVALSSTCPHLGCQVHWEAANNRFFCPCHNGVFEPSGRAISGPPADAGQALSTYRLKTEGGLLFMEVPQAVLAMGPGRIRTDLPRCGPGHDPCLAPEVVVSRSSRATGDLADGRDAVAQTRGA